MTKFNKLGGTGIMGYISPLHTDDTYAVIDPLYGIDGFRNVETIDAMLLIPEERRRAGMIVGVNGGKSYFKLKNIEWTGEITDWDEVFFQTSIKQDIIYIDKERVSGVIDGTNRFFTLGYKPIMDSEHIYLNGLLQQEGDENDYIIYDDIIEFLIPPLQNMKIICSYRTII